MGMKKTYTVRTEYARDVRDAHNKWHYRHLQKELVLKNAKAALKNLDEDEHIKEMLERADIVEYKAKFKEHKYDVSVEEYLEFSYLQAVLWQGLQSQVDRALDELESLLEKFRQNNPNCYESDISIITSMTTAYEARQIYNEYYLEFSLTEGYDGL